MQADLFLRFAPVIQSLSIAELNGSASLFAKLRLAQEGDLEICYAPIEYINRAARIVIVGITPGRTQMLNSLKEARRQLDRGADAPQVLRAAKQSAAFSGAMRPNLIRLLDHVGLPRWLGLRSCDALWGNASDLVQTTSVLRNPVFIRSGNYNGTPNMIRQPLLRAQLLSGFAKDAEALQSAAFLPLGDTVVEALHFLADHGLLDRERILAGLPHPSPANAERIAYFLGAKSRDNLSQKTDPDKLDRAREGLLRQISLLA